MYNTTGSGSAKAQPTQEVNWHWIFMINLPTGVLTSAIGPAPPCSLGTCRWAREASSSNEGRHAAASFGDCVRSRVQKRDNSRRPYLKVFTFSARKCPDR